MKKGLKLLIGLLTLYIIVAVVIPYINTLPFFVPIQRVIKKWDINSAAFFYTDHISSNPEITKFTDK